MTKRESVFYMNAGILGVLLLGLVTEGLAQQQGTEIAAPEVKFSGNDTRYSRLLAQDTSLNASRVIVGKNVQLSGPLVRPFKAGSIRDFPKRLLHLINPFATTEAGAEAQRMGNLSPRAWTSVVGWNTGPTSASVEVTHEPSMTLLSVSRP